MISPELILDNAEFIFNAMDDEANSRAAASRAYYSAYHSCKQVADQYVIPPKGNGGVHMTMYNGLMECHKGYTDNCEVVRRVAYIARGLKFIRTTADYTLDVSFPRSEAAVVIEKTRFILDMTKSI